MVNKKNNKSKVPFYSIFILVIIVLLISFFLHLFQSNKDADYSDKTIKQSLTAISTFDFSKVTSVEEEIRFLEATQAATNFDPSKPLTPAQYQQAFSGNIILGDSITEGLSAYGFLRSDQVFCNIGASIANGDSLFESAASTYPLRVFMSFGMNDILIYSGKTDPFIEKYEELIKLFQEISPDTKIYVNSISVPGPAAIENQPNLGKYKAFNDALKKMCKDMDITYIDNTKILLDHPDYYAGDDIHVVPDYYPIWMTNMILKAGM